MPGARDAFSIGRALAAVRRANRTRAPASVTQIASGGDPFSVLVGTILSLRTQDATTRAAARRLLAVADGPEALLRLSVRRIERLIYPVGFYRTKARRLKDIARALLDHHGGKVPTRMEDLLALRGVGRKTANLVLTLGHDLPGICVDVHVHRITNRWGYVATRMPNDTETELRHILPKRHWKEINELLVTFGKTVCRPVSPWCTRCPVLASCGRVGVSTSR